MKSEERHELETNVLAKFLVTAGEKVSPYVSYVIYGLLAIVVVWGVVQLTSSSISSKTEQAWGTFATATLPGKMDLNQLEQAADQYPGETVGILGRLMWADGQLNRGCANFFTDKEAAMASLNQAQVAYEEVVAEATDEALRDRARLGIAWALEAKGQIAAATEAYKKVTGPFQEMAELRLEQLEEFDAAQYADWLASAEGARRSSGMGNLDGSTRPEFAPDQLGLPDGAPPATGEQGTAEEDFLEMLRRFEEQAPEAPSGDDRYDGPPADAAAPAGDGTGTGTAPGPDLFTDPPAAEDSTETPAPEVPAAESEAEPDAADGAPSDEESP